MKKLLLLLLAANFSLKAFNINKETFWNSPKKGANMFNKEIFRQDIKDAKKLGIQFIRIAPDRFFTKSKDFLFDMLDDYKRIIKPDLKILLEVLDIFHQENMPVVFTMLSLPGSRWRQNNNFKDDLRIWKNETYIKQAAKFWKDLVSLIKDHPAVVAYDLLNEPHPEKCFTKDQYDKKSVKNMMCKFYQHVIKEIRKVDSKTFIIIESSNYADPLTFSDLQAYDDNHILYSFHMYEPFIYTNRKNNKGRFTYPGIIDGKFYNKPILQQYFKKVHAFQKKYNIPNERILVGEFGANRFSKGIKNYFSDLTDIFKTNNWHYAFYAFREDVWDGMDYELSNKRLSAKYWTNINLWNILEIRKELKKKRNSSNSLFKILIK